MAASVKYYLDTHIPKSAAEQLRSRGTDVLRCEEVDMAAADDIEHLEFATMQQRTLVSHDRDFWTIHAEWLAQGLHHCGIILFSNRFQGNIGKIVHELTAFSDLITQGAGTLDKDVYNQVYEIDR